MRYVYDNSADNPRNPQVPPARVRWGQRSFDEMGDLWFQLATDSDADRSQLRAEVQTKMTAEDSIGLDTMLAAAPDDTELHDDAGVLALLLGRPAVAVGHFRATAAHRPNSAAAHFNLGTALTSAGLFDDAVASYERALAIDPRYAKALNNLGDTLMAMGRIAEAVPRYEQSVALDPSMPESRNNLGAALWRRGEYPRAERELREALRLRPGYPEAYFNLGHLAIRTGDVAAAAGYFRRAAAGKPEWVVALTTTSWVLSTTADPAVRAPADAVGYAEQAVALTGRQDPRALDTLSVALASAGRFDEAVATARQALALAPPPMREAIAGRIALFERREAFVDRQ